MSRTVWVVSSGTYSDYAVHAVFERREDAEQAAARIPEGGVEKRLLFGPGESAQFRLWPRVSVGMTVSADGKISELGTHTVDRVTDPEELEVEAFLRGTRYIVWAHSVDRERARKAVKERASVVAAALAEGRAPEVDDE